MPEARSLMPETGRLGTPEGVRSLHPSGCSSASKPGACFEPTMLVTFKEKLSEADALEMNIRENVGRNSQRLVDTAFQLYNAWSERGQSTSIWSTANELAPRVALSPATVKSLLIIMRNGEQEMLEAWRKCQLEIGHRDVQKIVEHSARFDHLAEFRKLVTGEKPSSHDPTLTQKSYFKALERARTFGRLLLNLEKSGFIKVNVMNVSVLSNDIPFELTVLLGRMLDEKRLLEEIVNGYKNIKSDRQSAIGSLNPDTGRRGTPVGE